MGAWVHGCMILTCTTGHLFIGRICQSQEHIALQLSYYRVSRPKDWLLDKKVCKKENSPTQLFEMNVALISATKLTIVLAELGQFWYVYLLIASSSGAGTSPTICAGHGLSWSGLCILELQFL